MKKTEAIEYIKKNCCGEWCEDDWREAMDMATEALKCSESPKSSDSIGRQAAIDEIGKLSDEMYRTVEKGATFPTGAWFDGMAQTEHIVKNLPPAQPEIIRCKDCKYWRDDHTCREHSLVSPMCANEYCSRAERRTDG